MQNWLVVERKMGTPGKLINLGNAYEVEYNEEKHLVNVWWAGNLPGSTITYHGDAILAELYDTKRLATYSVAPNDWLAFISRALPDG